MAASTPQTKPHQGDYLMMLVKLPHCIGTTGLAVQRPRGRLFEGEGLSQREGERKEREPRHAA